MQKLEEKYTSTLTKILGDLDRLKLIQEKGIFKPNSLQLAPTDKCNLNCEFCSVKKRKMNEIKFSDIKKVIDDFVELGLKTVEITGGGDPTMYDDINPLIDYCYEKGLKIGFITNGVLLNKNVSDESLEKLTWIRISMNSLEQVGDFDFHIPEKVTLGLSYVWSGISSEEKLKWIEKYKNKHNATYVRVVPNCLSREEMNYFKKHIGSTVRKYDGFFPQSKDYSKPQKCWIGYLKPFLNSDGYIYHCSAIPLIYRQFYEKFRMGHWTKIKEIWANPKPFDTKDCDKCFFRIQSEVIEALMTKSEHKDFI